MSRKKRYTISQEDIEKIISIDGNTVRKLEVVPDIEPLVKPKKIEKPKKETEPLRRQNKKQAKGIGKAYVAAMTFFLVSCLMICVGYLNLHAENTRVKDSITDLESELDTLTAQNDSLDYTINSYTDLDYISDAATALGMVRITKDQITLYDSTDYEYMQQYSDLPED